MDNLQVNTCIFRTYIEARYIVLRYIMPNWTIKSVKHFRLTYHIVESRQVFLLDKISYNQTCKNAGNTSYSNIPLVWGDILHYKTFVRLWNQGHVFHSHVTLKIQLKISPHPLHHKLYQIPAQFTQNHPNSLRNSLR